MFAPTTIARGERQIQGVQIRRWAGYCREFRLSAQLNAEDRKNFLSFLKIKLYQQNIIFKNFFLKTKTLLPDNNLLLHDFIR